MKKFFGVGEDDNTFELEEDLESVEVSEENAGQIALDILDNDDKVVIIAPIAGIDLEDIDISFTNINVDSRQQ